MAATSASRRWVVLARTALATSAVATTVLVGLATSASAHVPVASADCKDGKTVLHVVLEKYDGRGTNTVKVTDGNQVLLDTQDFKSDFQKDWNNLAGDTNHHFVVSVKAWDDKDGKKGFTKDFTLDVKACVEQPPTKTTTTTTTTTTTAATHPTTTTTTPVAVGASANLAETGASIALPLGIGALLLVGGVGMLFVVRKRRKA